MYGTHRKQTMKTKFFYTNRMWLWPLIALLVITPFTAALDFSLSQWFYDRSHFEANAFFKFFYNYGFYPANLTAVTALVILIASYFKKSLVKWRSAALVLVLTLAIGSGFITHVVLKDTWGRPRPKQVVEFGGKQEFRPYYKPNFFHQPEPSKSFPSGHSSTGFYFFALALVGRREGNRTLYWTGIVLSLGLGITLSLTRIAQGGHFFSDTLLSAYVMLLTACLCTHFVYGWNQRRAEAS